MGRPAGWMRELTGRGAMRSPGAPSLRHEVERLFWKQIATGITSERAAEAVGVSQPAGARKPVFQTSTARTLRSSSACPSESCKTIVLSNCLAMVLAMFYKHPYT
jgi:hypothetical protein